MKKNVRSVLLLLVLAALLIVPDQLTKAWAVARLKDAEDIVWIRGVFQLHYLENRGMAFGFFQNQRLFFLIATGIVLLLILWAAWKTPLRKRWIPLYTVLVFLTAGAVGNLIDRVRQGYVVDFLYFSLIDFPVFNVADIYVTCSGICLFLLLLFVYKEEELSSVYGRKK